MAPEWRQRTNDVVTCIGTDNRPTDLFIQHVHPSDCVRRADKEVQPPPSDRLFVAINRSLVRRAANAAHDTVDLTTAAASRDVGYTSHGAASPSHSARVVSAVRETLKAAVETMRPTCQVCSNCIVVIAGQSLLLSRWCWQSLLRNCFRDATKSERMWSQTWHRYRLVCRCSHCLQRDVKYVTAKRVVAGGV